MECLQMETTTTLMSSEQKKECNEDNIYLRFCRKKYKCVLMWLLSIITVSQLFIIIFEKIDKDILIRITNMLVDKSNSTAI